MQPLRCENINLKGSFSISNNFSLEETAKIINEALNIDLQKDDSGYYEEIPAYSDHTLGMTLVLLGIPEKKYQITENDNSWYNFQVSDNNTGDSKINVNFGTYLIAILNSRSKLVCKEEWNTNHYIKNCVNVFLQE
jgi:hypothetical protein